MFRSKCRRYKDAYINYNPIIDIKTQDFEFFTRQMMKPNFHFKDKITQDPSPKSTLTTTEFSVPKKNMISNTGQSYDSRTPTYRPSYSRIIDLFFKRFLVLLELGQSRQKQSRYNLPIDPNTG